MNVGIKEFENNIFQVDLLHMDRPELSAAYIIKGNPTCLIETGASCSVPILLKSFEELQIKKEEIQYVIVTHIHLDHSGGAGLLMKELPNAKLIVHPKGAKHLIDPAKLIASAKEVYGELFHRLFDPIVAIPEERLIIADDGFQLPIGEPRTLTFLNSPGHAYHHFAVYDNLAKGLFSGDSAGICYPIFKRRGETFCFPSSSPTQFDPEAMLHTIQRFQGLDLKNIFVTHFGMQDKPQLFLEKMKERVHDYVEIAEKAVNTQPNPTWETVKDLLENYYEKELKAIGIYMDDEIRDTLAIDLELNAKGLLHSFLRSKK
jgi:glyoxylase-like metal-dependent hydrolase (beta-lactamase superfamily II)